VPLPDTRRGLPGSARDVASEKGAGMLHRTAWIFGTKS
jgi:hypothetical protein